MAVLRRAGLILALVLCATPAFAQFQHEDDPARNGALGLPILGVRTTSCGTALSGSANDWNVIQFDAQGNLCVNIATNGAGSTTDTDDGSIAISQTSVALTAGLQMYYNGTAWVRMTPSPCGDASLLTTVAISQTASTKLISAASSKKNYLCNLVIVAGAAEIVGMVEGTGSTCGTGTAALIGSTTAANSMSFLANGGVSLMGGVGGIIKSAGANVDVCLMQSGSNRVSGFLTYAQL